MIADFLPTNWLLLLWITLLGQTHFEATRWLQALYSSDVQPVFGLQVATTVGSVVLVGRCTAWACYGWYGWKAGWQPAVGLAVSSFAVRCFLLNTIVVFLVNDERLFWPLATGAILPLCVVSALTVYWL